MPKDRKSGVSGCWLPGVCHGGAPFVAGMRVVASASWCGDGRGRCDPSQCVVAGDIVGDAVAADSRGVHGHGMDLCGQEKRVVSVEVANQSLIMLLFACTPWWGSIRLLT